MPHEHWSILKRSLEWPGFLLKIKQLRAVLRINGNNVHVVEELRTGLVLWNHVLYDLQSHLRERNMLRKMRMVYASTSNIVPPSLLIQTLYSLRLFTVAPTITGVMEKVRRELSAPEQAANLGFLMRTYRRLAQEVPVLIRVYRAKTSVEHDVKRALHLPKRILYGPKLHTERMIDAPLLKDLEDALRILEVTIKVEKRARLSTDEADRIESEEVAREHE